MKIPRILGHKRLKWRHGLLIALLLLIALIKMAPRWGVIYTFVVYPRIGALLSHLSGCIPFALGDLFIAASIAWVVCYPLSGFLRFSHTRTSWKKILAREVEFLLWIYAWFYLAWGLNYSQPDIFSRMKMTPAKVSKNTLRKFANTYVDSLNLLSEEVSIKGEESKYIKKLENFDNVKVKSKVETLKGYNDLSKCPIFMGINTPFNQNPHVKTMTFSWLSSMAGVTGSMGPFFCEFTLNKDVLPHEYPATYAHEFAHFLGIANEGEANFYSYLVCTNSNDRYVKFSGYYHILFHVIANVYDILGKEEGNTFVKRINPKVIALARNDRKYWLDKRCKAIDKVQDFIFELYLKGNNVKEGRKSYSGVILLIMSWEEKLHIII